LGREGCVSKHVVGFGRAEWNAGLNRKLVHRQSAGLVAAKNVHAGELLDGGQPRDDRLLKRQRIGPDRHRDGHHCRQRDRDRRNQQYEHVLRDPAEF
jgi:hypothetical protein